MTRSPSREAVRASLRGMLRLGPVPLLVVLAAFCAPRACAQDAPDPFSFDVAAYAAYGVEAGAPLSIRMELIFLRASGPPVSGGYTIRPGAGLSMRRTESTFTDVLGSASTVVSATLSGEAGRSCEPAEVLVDLDVAGEGSWTETVRVPRPIPAYYSAAVRADGDPGEWPAAVSLASPEGADPSAEISLAWDERGLHLLFLVADDVHLQDQGFGGDIWRQDSVQWAVDALGNERLSSSGSYDADDHEFGLALRDGEVVSWRWAGPPGMTVGPHGGPAAGVAAAVARREGVTVYEASLPWLCLAPFRPGSPVPLRMGFVINDDDGLGRRFVELPGGISGRKDPTMFLDVVLADAEGVAVTDLLPVRDAGLDEALRGRMLGQLLRVGGMAESLRSSVEAMSTPGLREHPVAGQGRELGRELAAVSARVATQWALGSRPRAGDAQPLSRAEEVDDTLARLSPLLAMHASRARAGASGASAASAASGASFALGAADSWRRVDIRRFEGEYPEAMSLSLCRNESESCQLVIVPMSAALHGVSIEVAPLTGPGEGVGVDWAPVGYVRTGDGVYCADPILRPGRRLEVPADRLLTIWITVHAGPDAPPGRYTGAVTVRPEGMAPQSVGLDVTVWDARLPLRPGLAAVCSLSWPQAERFYRTEAVRGAVRERWYDFFLSRRISPTSLYITTEPQPEPDDWPFCLDRGISAINLGYAYAKQGLRNTPEYFEDFLGRLEVSAERARAAGMLERCFVYVADEPEAADWPEIVRRCAVLAERFPDLRRMATFVGGLPSELEGYVDLWCIEVGAFDAVRARQLAARGDEVWWYTVTWGGVQLEDPPWEQRAWGWMSYAQPVSGVLHWMANRWGSNAVGEVRWPAADWVTDSWDGRNGPGCLVYPGPGLTPLSSVRWENLRDGLEDHDLFRLVEGLQSDEAHALLAEVRALAGSPSDYSRDVEAYVELRERAGRLLGSAAR